MTDTEKLNELYAVKRSIESKEFQEYVMKPLFAEMDKLKDAYDCESLRELSQTKGKKQGIQAILKIFKGIETDINTLYTANIPSEDGTPKGGSPVGLAELNKHKNLFEGMNIARKKLVFESEQESNLLDEKNIKDI